MMKSLIISIVFLYASSVHSHVLTINYSPVILVSGDEEELNDWNFIGDDDYSHFSVDSDDAVGLKFSYELLKSPRLKEGQKDIAAFNIYTEYLISDAEYKNGEVRKGKYQSLTSGVSLKAEKYLNDLFGSYASMGVGIGVSRFKLNTNKDRAVGELFAEGGFSFQQTVYLGIGVKFQMIGYPSETMATVGNLYLGLGVRF